jgi:hypothetical protein
MDYRRTVIAVVGVLLLTSCVVSTNPKQSLPQQV